MGVEALIKFLEEEFIVQEEDIAGTGKLLGWINWSYHASPAEAERAMRGMKRTEGRLRVVRTVTETLYVRDWPSER